MSKPPTKLLAQVADKLGSREASKLSKQRHNHRNCVFVGGLPYDCTEEQLRQHFSSEDCLVVGVRIIRDSESGIGKGFGYVEFKDPDSVQLAIAGKHRSEFCGRWIRVMPSSANPHQLHEQMSRQASRIREENQLLRHRWYFKSGDGEADGSSVKVKSETSTKSKSTAPKKKFKSQGRSRTNAK